ncbi:Rax2p [Sugiyamaella lignohabitans]|uniref:Rax2p n=1 Tax=Sugiyamaella lignohabitans TaxID=796027 RepID=A0A167DZY9_9ASCO|nr:Rax2p [Sugiyamaella lignohabitans]ANB13486.1 Rax2p [Sugiyamaella lignohabitans]
MRKRIPCPKMGISISAKSLLASILSLASIVPIAAQSSSSLSTASSSSAAASSSSSATGAQPTLEAQTVSLPSLNLGDLGNIGLVGSFDGVSQYSYVGQQESAQLPQNPYFDSIIAQLDSEQFLIQAHSNGIVNSACLLRDSIYFSGNFTNITQIQGQKSTSQAYPLGFAYINTTTGEVTHVTSTNAPEGAINTLYCDQNSNTVVAGGSFTFNKTTGVAIFDVTDSQWKSPLFGGFGNESSIDSISLLSNNNMLFGGSFTSLNASDVFSTKINTTTSQEQQVSFKLAQIDAEGTAPNSDATSILCPSDSSSWALTDGRQGTWQASLPYSFSPTRLRLYNLNDPTNGVKTWRFLAFPINGIMNLTYVDPTSGEKLICDAWCPLPQHGTVDYLDFEFINVIEMDGFQLFLLDNYGSYAGLSGVELFQDGKYDLMV